MNRRDALLSMTGLGGALITACTHDGHSKSLATLPETELMNEDTMRRAYLDTPYGQVYYWTAGNGPALVCVHQSGNSAEEFVGLIPYLAERSRLIALDLPGHGRSTIPDQELSVDDYAEIVRMVLDHLQVTRAHTVGHHGGALAALCFSANYPERVDKAILSGMGPPRNQADTDAFIASLSKGRATIHDDPEFIAKTWDRYQSMMSDEGDIAGVMKAFQSYLTSHISPYRSIMVNLRWDRRSSVERMKRPSLVLKGSKDPYVSDQTPLLDLMPNAQLMEMPGCGVFMFYDRPSVCADMIANYLEL